MHSAAQKRREEADASSTDKIGTAVPGESCTCSNSVSHGESSDGEQAYSGQQAGPHLFEEK